MLYYDKVMKEYEKSLKYDSILSYLESMYAQTKDEQILATLIGYAWYFLVEGDLDEPTEYNWEFSLEKWREYILKGELQKVSNELYLFIVGYSLMLNYEFLPEFKEIGVSKINILSELEHEVLTPIAKYLINRKKFSLKDRDDAILNYFNKKSILDLYFKEIFIGSRNIR